MDKKVIAMYLRLSGEDKDIGRNESNSIANQRQLILDYIQSDKILSKCEIREFVDDGVSGARFDQAAFQEMIEQPPWQGLSGGWQIYGVSVSVAACALYRSQ